MRYNLLEHRRYYYHTAPHTNMLLRTFISANNAPPLICVKLARSRGFMTIIIHVQNWDNQVESAESMELAESRAEIARLKAELANTNHFNAAKWPEQLPRSKIAHRFLAVSPPTSCQERRFLPSQDAKMNLRLAPQTQHHFKAASHKPDGWITVVKELQREVTEKLHHFCHMMWIILGNYHSNANTTDA